MTESNMGAKDTKGGCLTSCFGLLILMAGLYIVYAIITSIGGGDNGAGVKERPTEWLLASINAEDPGLDADDDSVYVFRRHLLSLTRKTTSSQQEIGDISVKTWTLVKEKGFPDTLLRVIEELDTSIPDGGAKMELAEIAAAWMVLRTAE